MVESDQKVDSLAESFERIFAILRIILNMKWIS